MVDNPKGNSAIGNRTGPAADLLLPHFHPPSDARALSPHPALSLEAGERGLKETLSRDDVAALTYDIR